MSDKKNKSKSLLKDIGILLSVWGPLLFIIIGGLKWRNGDFDGTIMEMLFPAIFFGFIGAYGTLLVVSNIFKQSTALWIVAAVLVFITTVILYMLNLTKILTIGAIVLGVLLCLLVIINWIAG